ncbi:MAG: serine/threonine protein kinase, partial [bacterium]
IADRSECPAYGGLVLRPQEGLLPIGRDPISGLWEFAHLSSGKPARRGPDGKLVIESDTGIVFILLAGGAFKMGETKQPGAPNYYDPAADEGPVHEVTLDPCFIAKFELTEGQWLHFTGERHVGVSGISPTSGPDPYLQPVKQVSWLEAREFLLHMGLDLPTEAQWEFAARAGTNTKWWTGSQSVSLQGAANIGDRTAALSGWPAPGGGYERGIEDGYVFDSPIGCFPPNAFGLHDVAGNVSEWCLDTFTAYSEPFRPGTGERIAPAESLTRVIRGGDWYENAWFARSAKRVISPIDYRHHKLGLRAARRVDSE